MKKNPIMGPRVLAEMGLYVGLYIVLTYLFSFTAFTRITFNFVVLLVCGIRLGPYPTMLVGLVSDIVGGLIFQAGVFHFGLTLNAVLSGFLYGALFYQQFSMSKFGLYILLEEIGVHLLLQSFWLKDIFGLSFGATILTRLPGFLIMMVIKIVFILALAKSTWYKRIANLQ